MPDYREIYNEIVESTPNYQRGQKSPGLRAVIESSDELSMLSGRSLDIGCGVGFVVEFLLHPTFDLRPFGVDISDVAIATARSRLSGIKSLDSRFRVLESQALPFDDDFFSLVTCFDVLEHLDEEDIKTTLSEIDRVLRPGGIALCTVSCRASGTLDRNGENLHRSVHSPDWWIEHFLPMRAVFDGVRNQISLWKRMPRKRAAQNKSTMVESKPDFPGKDGSSIPQSAPSISHGESPAPESSGSQDLESMHRSPVPAATLLPVSPVLADPAVVIETSEQLEECCLPEYRDWLLSPVVDLGCGNGNTVEKIRALGLECIGLDLTPLDSEMRVGDFTQPIPDINHFQSAVCINCIEHLFDEQIRGLFDNMKQVKRQAFSIRSANSTGNELLANRRDFIGWGGLIRENFTIAAAIKINDEQMLYLTQRK